MVNIMETHESYLFTPEALDASSHPFAPSLKPRISAALAGREPVTDPDDVEVPPYLPDTPVVRADIARLYDNIHYAERQLAILLSELEKNGLADNTIVIVTTDHGDGLPRAKRSLYDSGLHVPLMIRWPNGEGAGTRNGELVSFVDIAPTILSWAGVPVPEWMHGRVFAGEGYSPERGYVYAAMDRHDEVPDRIRTVRDARWKYMRNYQPDHAFFRHLAFRDILLTMQEMWRFHAKNRMTPAQEQYFDKQRPEEELYDTWADPYEVNNLAADPRYAAELARMRAAYDRFMQRVPDMSEESEAGMVAEMWPGYEQPVTTAPEAEVTSDTVTLRSATQGASIGYRVGGEKQWQLYTGPFAAEPGNPIEVKAVRYGYAESPVTRIEIE